MQNHELIANSIPQLKVVYLENASGRESELAIFLQEWYSDSPSIKVRTSGSTGQPKEIQVEKKFLIASAKMTIKYFDLKENHTALLCLNTSSIAGKMMIIRAIVANMTLFVAPVSSNPLELLNVNIDFAAMVPLQAQQILLDTPQKIDLIKILLIGGAAINSSLWEQLSEIPSKSYQSFGMTETYSHIALRIITKNEAPFEVLEGITIKADPTLEISAPELGVQRLKTNDIIELTDPQHFYWKGRADFVINSGGVKLHPEQIEHKLGTLISQPFFSTGLDDPKWGQKHILCVEGAISINRFELENTLDPYEIPKEIYFFKNFHYTHSGKIDRNRTLLKLTDARRQVL